MWEEVGSRGEKTPDGCRGHDKEGKGPSDLISDSR